MTYNVFGGTLNLSLLNFNCVSRMRDDISDLERWPWELILMSSCLSLLHLDTVISCALTCCISYMLHHVTLHCRQNDDVVSSTDGEVLKVRREVVGSAVQRRHQQHDVYCVDYYTSRISHSHCTLRAAYWHHYNQRQFVFHFIDRNSLSL